VSNGFLDKAGTNGADKCEIICYQYPDINLEWLITGKGEMLKPNISKDKSKAQASPSEPGKGIPLVSTEAAAGFGSDAFSIKESDVIQTYIIPDFQDIQFMLRVKGNSMSPSFQSGDIVACRVISNPSFIQWGKAHLIATHSQGMLIKRLRPSKEALHYRCISDNAEFDPFDIPHDEITGIALIVGFVRIE
jgi:phage repressor protein C with HTH and peptisase S24 domain